MEFVLSMGETLGLSLSTTKKKKKERQFVWFGFRCMMGIVSSSFSVEGFGNYVSIAVSWTGVRLQSWYLLVIFILYVEKCQRLICQTIIF